MDGLRSEDVQSTVSNIALALCPKRAMDNIFARLDDKDEVLVTLASEEIERNFEEYIGRGECTHILLGPSENLTAVEEALVGDCYRLLDPLQNLPQSCHRRK